MARPNTRYAAQMDLERNIARFVPYSNHVSPTTIVTEAGDYVRIWKVEGITHETSDPSDMQRRMDELNTMFRSLATPNVAVWTHMIRRKVVQRMESAFDNDFCRRLDEKYYDGFSAYKMMANELYFTVIYRPHVTRTEKIAVMSARRTLDEIREDQREAIRKMDELGYRIESGLRKYDPEVLSTYEGPNGALCSQALEFLNFLLSGTWQTVRVPKGKIAPYLGTAYVLAGLETIELRSASQSRFAQLVDLKDYPEYTEPGLLNDLMYLEVEFVVTHSFSFLSKKQGLDFLKDQQGHLASTQDGSERQIAEITFAIDAQTSGEFSMGEYHFSLMVYADDMKDLNARTAQVMTVLEDQGFLASKVATATDAAFFAQLPGNWEFRPRIARITSRNFGGLASLHNFAAGKATGNPWGDAVTLLKSPSMQPFYFNWHASKDDDDSFDKKLLGNTRVIGASGTGKTALVNFLLSQSQKFKVRAPQGFTTVVLDKDRGCELFVRTAGGKYLPMKPGKATGFNPFQLDPTDQNVLFLEEWTNELVESDGDGALNTAQKSAISHAVRTVMRMPKELRRLSMVAQNIQDGLSMLEQQNSISLRLQRWLQGGPYGWVFDNDIDTLDFKGYELIGVDGTHFLENKAISAPICGYLLYRMEEAIDGRRFIYFMDECQVWVNGKSKQMSEFAGNKQLTIRKQNGLGVFATQMPSKILESPVAHSLVQQVATEIYLPNPKADREEYMKGFKVTAAEFEIIASLADDSRMFLIKQGHRSALARLDLGGMDDELAILSGSTDNVELLDEIMDELGTEDPKIWLPIFHERRRERRRKSLTH